MDKSKRIHKLYDTLNQDLDLLTVSEILVNNEKDEKSLEVRTLFYRYIIKIDENKGIDINMKVRCSKLLFIVIGLTIYFALFPIIFLIGVWGVIERRKIKKAIK